jgi:hypothetical protein
MNFEEKSKYINDLKNYINRLVDTKPTIEYIKNTKEKKTSECIYCGGKCTFNTKRCSECQHKHLRKVERPNLEIILNDINILGYVGTGRKYGVSDNTIRKWIKNNK